MWQNPPSFILKKLLWELIFQFSSDYKMFLKAIFCQRIMPFETNFLRWKLLFMGIVMNVCRYKLSLTYATVMIGYGSIKFLFTRVQLRT